ncbi:MAG: nucleotidyl transferase AbiEii/AbiGii toxin family protein [Formivibrio sp.]|nr:nucleotidyl transferase AbiEii/AbiGii toxin family protein [Formivibrio sp.]
MKEFLQASLERRRQLCDEAQARLGLRAASIEKDFWVCWTLRELFSLPGCGAHLTFKGGTSLSKGWKLIERFSEDIDVVMEREFLGFGGAKSPENAGSKKQQEKRLEELKLACQKRIKDSLKPELEKHFQNSLPKGMKWDLLADADDADGQTLLFHYPSAYADAAYIRPVVKIELGARSDTEPCGMPQIQPYLKEAFPDLFVTGAFSIRTVEPIRTFWEKAMLLHEETFRKSDGGPKVRLARHYYDLWCLIKRDVAEKAKNDLELFKRVAAHRAVFFRKSKEAQESLRPGSLRLIPLPEQLPAWKRDYQSMSEAMFFGEVPAFDEILRVVGDFEKRFNKAN